jgi:hypothetical protein
VAFIEMLNLDGLAHWLPNGASQALKPRRDIMVSTSQVFSCPTTGSTFGPT